MRRTAAANCRQLLTATAALAIMPVTAAAQQPLAQASASQIAIPALAYTTHTLSNGLKVYALPDTSTANVTVQMWYHVGSKDDPSGALRLRPPVRAHLDAGDPQQRRCLA